MNRLRKSWRFGPLAALCTGVFIAGYTVADGLGARAGCRGRTSGAMLLGLQH